MKVCYFGTFDPLYTRNRIQILGLEQNGVEVILCTTTEKSKIKKYWQLIKKHWAVRHDHKVMIVGFAGHAIMPLAWLLAKLHRKIVIFDVFVSEYDSIILDRQDYPRISLVALKYWFMDWLSCTLADVVLLDTQPHIDFFVRTFHLNSKKFRKVEIGCDQDIFYPRPKPPTSSFVVHFHGSYAPVQGVPYIIEAAKLLAGENITFNIIGKLKNYRREIEQVRAWELSNVFFIDILPYEQLAVKIAQADVCLGMFGETPKAQITPAFKIIEAMASKRAVITADSPAMRTFFTDRVHCLLAKTADAPDLSDKILLLKSDELLRQQLAENGHRLFLEHFTPKVVGQKILEIVESLLKNKKSSHWQ